MKISSLYVYPIKSLRGVSLDSAEANYQGLQYDRRFMLFNLSQQKNMHVSNCPQMCLFITSIVYPTKEDPDCGKVIVTYQEPSSTERKTLEIPLDPKTAGLKEMEITMHNSTTKGYDMGGEPSKWFSDCFGYEVTLVYIGKNRREVLGNMAPAVAWKQQQHQSWLSTLTSSLPFSSDVAGVDEGISFADVSPYLVITEKSWENANARLPATETLDITKFRPNIVLEGAEEAFEEDFWAELLIGETLKIVLTQNCARCKSINVDYATGKPGTNEAGSMLKKLQKDRRIDIGTRWSPVFGRYGFLGEAVAGSRMMVGNEVRVLRRNRERTVFGKWYMLSG
jgi:uncharacterized protein YcbX